MVLCILLGHMQSWAEVLELSVALPGSCPCGERFDDTTVSHKKNYGGLILGTLPNAHTP